MVYSTSNPNGIELKCTKCLEGTIISNDDGILLQSATNFIVDHAECEYDTNEDEESTPIAVLQKVVDAANNYGVTDNQSTNGGLL